MNAPALYLDLVRLPNIGLDEQHTHNLPSPRLCVRDAATHDADGNRIYANADGVTAHIANGSQIVRIVSSNDRVDVEGYVNALPCVHHPA